MLNNMKKLFFKSALSLLAVAALFSSCLGESNNEIDRTNRFAYITSMNTTSAGGVKCAASDGSYFTSSYIQQQLTTGSCYLISFRSSLNSTYPNIYDITETAPAVKLESTVGVVGPVTKDDTVNPTSLAYIYGDPSNFYGNNWGFRYTVKVGKNDTPRAYFFYDRDNQTEDVNGVPQPLAKNRMIIDVRFDYVPGADNEKTQREVVSVGNLDNILRNFVTDANRFEQSVDQLYTDVFFKLRYNQLQPDGTTVKENTLVGSWTLESGQALFFRHLKN